MSQEKALRVIETLTCENKIMHVEFEIQKYYLQYSFNRVHDQMVNTPARYWVQTIYNLQKPTSCKSGFLKSCPFVIHWW